jgi:hypothetical protein
MGDMRSEGEFPIILIKKICCCHQIATKSHYLYGHEITESKFCLLNSDEEVRGGFE